MTFSSSAKVFSTANLMSRRLFCFQGKLKLLKYKFYLLFFELFFTIMFKPVRRSFEFEFRQALPTFVGQT